MYHHRAIERRRSLIRDISRRESAAVDRLLNALQSRKHVIDLTGANYLSRINKSAR